MLSAIKRATLSAKRDDHYVAHPRRAHSCEWSEQIFSNLIQLKTYTILGIILDYNPSKFGDRSSIIVTELSLKKAC